jgi:hypothetical protein
MCIGLGMGTPDTQCKESSSHNPAIHDVVDAFEETTNDPSCCVIESHTHLLCRRIRTPAEATLEADEKVSQPSYDQEPLFPTLMHTPLNFRMRDRQESCI